MFYRGHEHKRIFLETLKELYKPVYQMTPEFLSALFLLTSNNKLWHRVKNAVSMNVVEFEKINIRKINIDGYTLCKLAQDLYEGTSHVDFANVSNPDIVSDKLFNLIKSALQIKRNGCCAFKIHDGGL